MEIPDHHGMLPQLQMIPRSDAVKAGNALSVQLLCAFVQKVTVMVVHECGHKGKRPIPKDLFQPVKAFAINRCSRCVNADDLTTPMINEFIEKILVHAPEKVDGERRMAVDVYFRFIGNFTVPEIEKPLSSAEQSELEKVRKERERNRQKYQRRKQRLHATTA